MPSPAVRPADASSGKPAKHNRESALAAARRELDLLYAALDNVKTGLLILDRDLLALYSNPALHQMFKSLSPGKIRNENPHYVELLKSASSSRAVEGEDYIPSRLEWVRSGAAEPVDLHMNDGTVLRCQVAVLPDGGRMLTYSDVTDIVRNAEELERLATTDGMTGIYNRRHFLTLADREWSRSRRYGRPLSLLIFDIDYFKAINDRFGHDIGDQVIVHMTNLVRERKRDTDVLARIGGEEFALLLPETTLAQANDVADRLRSDIERSPVGIASRSVAATVSIGVAAATSSMREFADLMRVADHALYDAKHAGRNRVAAAG